MKAWTKNGCLFIAIGINPNTCIYPTEKVATPLMWIRECEIGAAQYWVEPNNEPSRRKQQLLLDPPQHRLIPAQCAPPASARIAQDLGDVGV